MIHTRAGFVFFLGALLMLPAALPAQRAAAQMDALLGSPAVTWDAAAAIILDAAGIASGSAGAFEYCRNQRWIPRLIHPGEPITMQSLSLLAMRAFRLPGGIMYRSTHNARYAFREMRYREFLPPRADPSFTISGEDLLYVIHRILSETGYYNE